MATLHRYVWTRCCRRTREISRTTSAAFTAILMTEPTHPDCATVSCRVSRPKGDTAMNIDRTLAALARQMDYLANTAMGDLSKDEADLFHTACDNINQLMESRDRANNGLPE